MTTATLIVLAACYLAVGIFLAACWRASVLYDIDHGEIDQSPPGRISVAVACIGWLPLVIGACITYPFGRRT